AMLHVALSPNPTTETVLSILCNGTLVFYAAIATASSYVKAFSIKDTGVLGQLHILHLIPIAMMLSCGSIYGQVVQQTLPGHKVGTSAPFDQSSLMLFSAIALILSVLYGMTVEVFLEHEGKR